MALSLASDLRFPWLAHRSAGSGLQQEFFASSVNYGGVPKDAEDCCVGPVR
jgi:hypothetical protein